MQVDIHLHPQAFFGANDIIVDGDEPFTDERLKCLSRLFSGPWRRGGETNAQTPSSTRWHAPRPENRGRAISWFEGYRMGI